MLLGCGTLRYPGAFFPKKVGHEHLTVGWTQRLLRIHDQLLSIAEIKEIANDQNEDSRALATFSRPSVIMSLPYNQKPPT